MFSEFLFFIRHKIGWSWSRNRRDGASLWGAPKNLRVTEPRGCRPTVWTRTSWPPPPLWTPDTGLRIKNRPLQTNGTVLTVLKLYYMQYKILWEIGHRTNAVVFSRVILPSICRATCRYVYLLKSQSSDPLGS